MPPDAVCSMCLKDFKKCTATRNAKPMAALKISSVTTMRIPILTKPFVENMTWNNSRLNESVH